MIDSVNFAKWLEQKIDQYHLTIYQVSKYSGVHQSTIKNWLNGSKPQTEKMEAVVKAIGEIEDTYIEIGTDLLEMANVLPEKTAKEKAHDPKTVGARWDNDEDFKEAVALLKKMDKETLRVFVKAARGAVGEQS